jgi:hypothetical protein
VVKQVESRRENKKSRSSEGNNKGSLDSSQRRLAPWETTKEVQKVVRADRRLGNNSSML